MTIAGLERALARARARRAEAVERCGLCGIQVAPGHRHLLAEPAGDVVCACPACSLLFESAAGDGRYRPVPQRRLRLQLDSTDELNVPVGLAFFVRGTDGQVRAHYPSPLGTTESVVDPAAWQSVVSRSEVLQSMATRVEALLVRTDTRGGADEQWLVPIDDCFRLVATIRRNWTGMSGGTAIWREISVFFQNLNPDRRIEEA